MVGLSLTKEQLDACCAAEMAYPGNVYVGDPPKTYHKPIEGTNLVWAVSSVGDLIIGESGVISLIDLAPSEMPAVWPEFSTDKDSA